MENRSHALVAGLFAVGLVCAAALALWWLSGAREATNTYLLVTRGSVTGLNPEAQVRYRGIRAGKVLDIRPDANDPRQLLVEISLDRAYGLTDRTLACINQQGVTGLSYVMLDEPDGPPGRPLAGDGSARLPIQPGLFDTLGDRAGDIATQVAELSARLNRLLDDRNLRNLSATLDNLNAASAGLKELPAVVASLRAALSPENLAHLHGTLAHLDAAAGGVAPLTESLDALARKLDRGTLPRAEALADDLTATARRLDRLLQSLERSPQSLIFGNPAIAPGPGEAGHVAPAPTDRSTR